MKLIEKIKSFFKEEKSARITLGPSTGLDDSFLFDSQEHYTKAKEILSQTVAEITFGK